jgi:hypothetical protein
MFTEEYKIIIAELRKRAENLWDEMKCKSLFGNMLEIGNRFNVSG